MPPRWRVELTGHIRTWLERAADHVLDRLQPSESGLAYEGGRHDRDRPDARSLGIARCAIRYRGSAFRDQRKDIRQTRRPAEPGRVSARRGEALDHDEIAARLAAIRQGREVDKEHVDQEVEPVKEEERQSEQEREERPRDHGM